MYDPWSHLEALPGVTVRYERLPHGIWGHTDFARRTITLTEGMDQGERRTTLAHELIHLERGPAPKPAASVEEAVVELLTAARCIHPAQLMEIPARVRAVGPLRASDEFGIDYYMAEVAAVILAEAIEKYLGRK